MQIIYRWQEISASALSVYDTTSPARLKHELDNFRGKKNSNQIYMT